MCVRVGATPLHRSTFVSPTVPRAMSFSPGDGSVLSRWAFARMAFALLASVPFESLTMTFCMP